MQKNYRVTGDHMRVSYSHHATEAAAIRAAVSLSKKWGVSHIGSEPRVERMTEDGWTDVSGFNAGRRID